MHRAGFAALAAVGVFGFASIAPAADMPVKAPAYKAPIAAPIYNWTGFYVGGNIGIALDGGNTRFVNWTASGFDPGPTFDRSSSTSAIGGIHGGFNWQAAPAWLLGVEADWDWTSLGKTDSAPINFGGVPFGVSNTSVTDHINWLASVRGRVGYVMDSTMLYATGGVAWTHQELSGFLQPNNAALVAPYSTSNTKTGWVAGAGIEHIMAAQWIVRAEWLHYGFSGATVADACAAIGCPGTGFITYGRTNIDTLRVGVSYLFGSPVVQLR